MYTFFDFDYEKAAFEWDDDKDHRNFVKHGIRFSTAIKVFRDERKLIRYDDEHKRDERYDVLGKVGQVLFVVCAFKEEEVVRIISARIATPEERKRYEYGENYDE